MSVVFRSTCVVNWRLVGVIKFLNEKKMKIHEKLSERVGRKMIPKKFTQGYSYPNIKQC